MFMQIRELHLKELDVAWELVCKLPYAKDYESFEDIVYEAKERYIMIGVFEKEALLAFAGVSIMTTLKNGRHIRVFDIVAKDEKSKKELMSYLEDFARLSMAQGVVYE